VSLPCDLLWDRGKPPSLFGPKFLPLDNVSAGPNDLPGPCSSHTLEILWFQPEGKGEDQVRSEGNGDQDQGVTNRETGGIHH
jgi:hypothetical protein